MNIFLVILYIFLILLLYIILNKQNINNFTFQPRNDLQSVYETPFSSCPSKKSSINYCLNNSIYNEGLDNDFECKLNDIACSNGQINVKDMKINKVGKLCQTDINKTCNYYIEGTCNDCETGLVSYNCNVSNIGDNINIDNIKNNINDYLLLIPEQYPYMCLNYSRKDKKIKILPIVLYQEGDYLQYWVRPKQSVLPIPNLFNLFSGDNFKTSPMFYISMPRIVTNMEDGSYVNGNVSSNIFSYHPNTNNKHNLFGHFVELNTTLDPSKFLNTNFNNSLLTMLVDNSYNIIGAGINDNLDFDMGQKWIMIDPFINTFILKFITNDKRSYYLSHFIDEHKVETIRAIEYINEKNVMYNSNFWWLKAELTYEKELNEEQAFYMINPLNGTNLSLYSDNIIQLEKNTSVYKLVNNRICHIGYYINETPFHTTQRVVTMDLDEKLNLITTTNLNTFNTNITMVQVERNAFVSTSIPSLNI